MTPLCYGGEVQSFHFMARSEKWLFLFEYYSWEEGIAFITSLIRSHNFGSEKQTWKKKYKDVSRCSAFIIYSSLSQQNLQMNWKMGQTSASSHGCIHVTRVIVSCPSGRITIWTTVEYIAQKVQLLLSLESKKCQKSINYRVASLLMLYLNLNS